MFETARDLFYEVVDVDPGAVGAAPSTDLTPAQLVGRIAATERVVNALLAEQARDIAAFAQARVAEDKQLGLTGPLRGRTVGIELALALGVAVVTAGKRATQAMAAVIDHPALLGLLGTGRVTMAGLTRAVQETEVLPSEQRRVVDAQLAQDVVADRLTPGMLEQAARRRTQAADTEAADKRAERERSDRRVHVMAKPDGVSVLWAKLRAEEAMAVHDALDSRARAMRADGDERSLQELMCDQLVESITGHPMTRPGDRTSPPPPTIRSTDPPEPDPDPWDVSVPEPYDDDVGPPATKSPPSKPQRRVPAKVEVQVVISAATLLGLDDEPALLRGYGAIPRKVVDEVVDSAESTVLRGLFCDPVDGRLVAMDAKTRCFVGGLRQFAMFRDQRCRLTGGRIVDIDHIVAVQDGGATTAGNGQGLSKNPHVVKDHPAVSVIADSAPSDADPIEQLRHRAPTITWTMPTGHSYRLPPPPALDWGSRPSPLKAPRPQDSKQVVDEIRSRIEQRSGNPRPDRTGRQRRRRAARRERRDARVELATWRRERQTNRHGRRQAVQHRRQLAHQLVGSARPSS